MMEDLSQYDTLSKKTYLLHCRPRLLFHLGQIYMLNILYDILCKGDNVIILIIPYDEHEKKNKTIKNRLQEEIDLTKNFYLKYLEYSSPQLKVMSIYDLDIPKERLFVIQKTYLDLYRDKTSFVKKMIDEKNRVWASPNILFVPKCIAAIEMLKPDYLICGRKHKMISDCFSEILKSINCNPLNDKFVPLVFEDFKDLFMKEAMDSTDSVNTYIEVKDNEDFVLQKLSMLKNNILKSRWLEHFMQFIFNKAPERIKLGINQMQRTDSEKVIALNKFLKNVRDLIPYLIDSSRNDLTIAWSNDNDISKKVSECEKPVIERIVRSAYSGKELSQLTIQRIFSAGKSGSLVFEIREFEKESAQIISNVSVLKIGDHDELIKEYNSYKEFIENKKTNAFMSISARSIVINNKLGILYQDAQHCLGINKQGRIDTVDKLFTGKQKKYEHLKCKLETLFKSHLNEVLYKHGSKVELASIKHFYNEFLPSEYKIEVDFYDKNNNVLKKKIGSGDRSFKNVVEITEVNLNKKFARAYTANSHVKLDLILNGDESMMNAVALSKGRKMNLYGEIISTRSDFYEKLLSDLNIKREQGLLMLSDKIKITDTISKIDELLSREYSNFQVSPVHGDLHSGNVLYGKENFGIIDYGKMRKKFPSFYDISYLLASVKINRLTNGLSLEKIYINEKRFSSSFSFLKLLGKEFKFLEIFEYRNLPDEIKSHGDENLFYATLTLAYLGMLKFDLNLEFKKAALIYSHFSFLKIKR